METGWEKLESISDRGVPPGIIAWRGRPRLFKFRVTYRATVVGADKPHEAGFCYYDLVSARRCYRDMLLGLYRNRNVVGFAICLNRYGVGKWEDALYFEADGEVVVASCFPKRKVTMNNNSDGKSTRLHIGVH